MDEIVGGKRQGRIIKIDWQLPARLRQPVRKQLQKERLEKAKRDSVVRFERRVIDSQLPAEPPKVRQLRGSVISQQTGDVYKNSRPNLKIGVPPYGKFVPNKQVKTQSRKLKTENVKSINRPKKIDVAQGVLVQEENKLEDTPIRQQAKKTERKIKPKRFALPLQFSIWPGKRLKQSSKKKAYNSKKL